jgi:hypothetical protein
MVNQAHSLYTIEAHKNRGAILSLTFGSDFNPQFRRLLDGQRNQGSIMVNWSRYLPRILSERTSPCFYFPIVVKKHVETYIDFLNVAMLIGSDLDFFHLLGL